MQHERTADPLTGTVNDVIGIDQMTLPAPSWKNELGSAPLLISSFQKILEEVAQWKTVLFVVFRSFLSNCKHPRIKIDVLPPQRRSFVSPESCEQK